MSTQYWPSTATGNRRILRNRVTKSSAASAGVYTPSADDFMKSFYAVLQRWERETASLSDPDLIRAHPSFAALVKHAPLALPLILSELRRRPSFLVWVLAAAYGNRMDAPRVAGNIRKVTDAWLSWGLTHGSTS